MITRSFSAHRAPVTADRARHWTDNALCRRVRDPEAFFPVGGGATVQQQIDDAKQFCTGCPVRMDCALSAVKNGWAGVWGGLDEMQRRRILRNHPDDHAQGIREEWARRLYDPYFDAYLRRTEQEDGGHVRWTNTSTSITVLGRTYTPAQLALWIALGREAHGTVKAHCGRSGCVAPEHIGDDVVRMNRGRKRAQAAA
ncbi:WhiB family transcriptional regulator [Streptomyces sp. NBC_01565]|uniref:WhiB family transcriptional regulator n=1 Tax=Streptomyces sp. NBC_01565 TaxID=2975881 RepID=UPI002253C648|nr:WhiB family transcriptional regulator [Streptomyces sp. NBC_01565]MCX4540466.1 WhiB family transcriptional regulator [Streptomyces sp. NBC_01565]